MSRATPDFDPASVEVEAFHADIRALRAEIDASVSEEDLGHLRRIESWGRAATVLGLATCWIAPNPLSAAALGLGRSTRWLLMHHVGHRGYDRVPGSPIERTSKGFARGSRRFVDWLDWILPEAWVYEHNVLHHSHTGEDADPDLLERNAEGSLRTPNRPLALRYLQLALLAITWRASYYSPETLASLRRKGRSPQRRPRARRRHQLQMRQLGPCAASVSAPGGWIGRGCCARRSQWTCSSA